MLIKVMRRSLYSELLWKLKSLLVHRRVVLGNPYTPQEPSSMLKLAARVCMISGLVAFGSKFQDAMLLDTTQRAIERHVAMFRFVGIEPNICAKAQEDGTYNVELRVLDPEEQ